MVSATQTGVAAAGSVSVIRWARKTSHAPARSTRSRSRRGSSRCGARTIAQFAMCKADAASITYVRNDKLSTGECARSRGMVRRDTVKDALATLSSAPMTRASRRPASTWPNVSVSYLLVCKGLVAAVRHAIPDDGKAPPIRPLTDPARKPVNCHSLRSDRGIRLRVLPIFRCTSSIRSSPETAPEGKADRFVRTVTRCLPREPRMHPAVAVPQCAIGAKAFVIWRGLA